jgi:glycosyltransferase involved in cell wall biosynthesis
MFKSKRIGVVVPAYNEEKLIGDTIKSVPSYVDKVYVIDDCSTDNTMIKILEHSQEDDRVVVLKHKQNKGVGGAITTGFKKSIEDAMEIVTVMAGDNQMDPKYLPELLKPILSEGVEFTKGNRLKPGYWKGMSAFRLIGNSILSFLTKIVTGYWRIKDPQNGYIAITTDALKKIDLDSLYKGYAFENDLMVKANVVNLKMENVLVPAVYREEKSKIRYPSFIIKTSWFLFRSFFWRFWKKYIRNIHPIGFLLIFGSLLLLCGIVAGIVTSIWYYWLILAIGRSGFQEF